MTPVPTSYWSSASWLLRVTGLLPGRHPCLGTGQRSYFLTATGQFQSDAGMLHGWSYQETGPSFGVFQTANYP